MTDSLSIGLVHKQKECCIGQFGKLTYKQSARLPVRKRNRARVVEAAAQVIFTVCAFFSVFSVFFITLYMIANGMPAFFKLGVRNILFSAVWTPTAEDASYGIFYIILTSVVGTSAAILIGVPIALLTAVFLAEAAPKWLAALVKPAVELLAGIPSVIYGLLGMMILNPLMYRWELIIFIDSDTHRFTGGANLLSAVLVLAIMILPTVVSISEASLRAVPRQLKSSSLALGASHMQTIFKVLIPAAKPGIISAIVLGVGRAIGEAMAISLVSGNLVSLPVPFASVRFLTTAIAGEMGYANGVHRQVLFTIGLVLYAFIMAVNIAVNSIMKKGLRDD